MTERINDAGVKALVVALITLLLGVSHGLAADWPSILKQGKAKHTNFEKEIKDMAIVQESTMITPERKITSEMKLFSKGEKFRMETKTEMPEASPGMGGMETTMIYDGKDMWMISPFMGKKKLPKEKEKEHQAERNWWGMVSEKAKIVGTEKVGNRECYVVDFTEQKDSHFDKVWLDKKNLVLTKAESKGAKGKAIISRYSDFRKIKGEWEMPYKTEIYEGNKLLSTTLVKSLQVNKGLSDDLFDPNRVKAKESGMGDMMKMMMKERMGK
jgi:outer membrane lipoprotein-sorting protein